VTHILLRGVEGLNISSPFSGWPVTLQIVETRHRQWDRLGFEVTDAEEGSLRCWCRELVIDGSPAFG